MNNNKNVNYDIDAETIQTEEIEVVQNKQLSKKEKVLAWFFGLPSRVKDSFSHYKLNDWLTFGLGILLTCCYIGVMVYGILQKQAWADDALEDQRITVSGAQAQLIINSAIFGILAAWIPYFAKWILKVKVSFGINIIIQIFCASGMIIGEALQVYYLIPSWDVILHIFSGLFFTIIGYILFRIFTRHNKIKHKVLLGVMFGIFCSLAVSVLWEVYEFMCDSIGGLNMQKILPEDAAWFNGGDTQAILDIETYGEEILAFYSTPEGYKYALMDTMEDLVGCFLGTIATGIFIAIVVRFKPDAFENSIKIVRRNTEDLTYKKDRYIEDDNTVDDTEQVEKPISST